MLARTTRSSLTPAIQMSPAQTPMHQGKEANVRSRSESSAGPMHDHARNPLLVRLDRKIPSKKTKHTLSYVTIDVTSM